MSFDLTDVLREFYLRTGQLRVGYATGGSTTTILDTFRNREGRDKAWKNGAAFVITSSDGLAPQAEFSRIETSIASVWQLTLSNTLTAAVGAGDYYGFTGPEYPLYEMIQLVNSALRKLGPLDLVDKTTLDSVSNQSEYDASADWKNPYGPFRVDVAQNDDTDDQQWLNEVDHDWEPALAGSGGKILFPNYPSHSGKDIRVWYRGSHPTVSTFDDVIDGRFDPEVVIQATLSAALDWNNTRIRGGDKFLLKRSGKAEADLMAAKREQPPVQKAASSKLLTLRPRSHTRYPGDRNPT